MKSLSIFITLLIAITGGCSKKEPAIQLPEGTSLQTLVLTYFAIQEAFAEDNLEGAKTGSIAMTATTNTQYKDLPVINEILAANEAIRTTDDIEVSRIAFKELSDVMIELASSNSDSLGLEAYVTHCPMAFAYEGADWLQKDDQINNPYEGSRMRTCGAVNATLGSK